MDEEGLTLRPSEEAARFKALGVSEHPAVEARAEAVLAQALGDLDEIEHRRKRLLAYLGRYMRQPLSELEGMTTNELRDWVAAVSEIVAEENGPSVSQASRGESNTR